jgi:hypothetical protein
VRGCLWCLDGPDETERGLLDQLGAVAADRGVEVSDLVEELRATYHQARAAHDTRTEHYTWAAIRAITAVSDARADFVPVRVMAISGAA